MMYDNGKGRGLKYLNIELHKGEKLENLNLNLGKVKNFHFAMLTCLKVLGDPKRLAS